MIRAGILGEDEHLELIGGRIVAMSPEGPVHAGAIDLCAEVLRRVFGNEHTVRVQHPLAVDFEDEPEPDIAVVRGGPREHLAEHPHDGRAGRRGGRVVARVRPRRQGGARTRAPASRTTGSSTWSIAALEVHRDPAPGGYRSVRALAAGDEIAPLAAPSSAVAVANLLP